MIDQNEFYIGEDGLKYCSKCQEPIERKVPNKLLGENYIHPSMCLCRRREWEQEEKERREREHLENVKRYKSTCFVDRRMRDWTFENDNGCNLAMERAKAFVEHWADMKRQRCGLLLWGDVGTGKTYMAACIANALLEQERPVLMKDFTEIANISLFDMDECKNSLARYELLILDDLGVQRESEFAIQNVYTIINHWWILGKPLIVTTNLTLDEMKSRSNSNENMDHKRIYDRILEMCMPVLVTGESQRKESAKQKMGFLKTILGKGN